MVSILGSSRPSSFAASPNLEDLEIDSFGWVSSDLGPNHFSEHVRLGLLNPNFGFSAWKFVRFLVIF